MSRVTKRSDSIKEEVSQSQQPAAVAVVYLSFHYSLPLPILSVGIIALIKDVPSVVFVFEL